MAPRLGPNYAIRALFCAQCHASRDHLFTVQANELVGVCKCGRSIKFPLFETREQLEAFFADHDRANREGN